MLTFNSMGPFFHGLPSLKTLSRAREASPPGLPFPRSSPDFALEMCLGLVETAVNPLLKARLAELLTKLVTEKSLGGIA